MRKVVIAVVVAAIVVVASFATYEFYNTGGSSCGSIQPGTIARSQVQNVTFGAVTEYALPGQDLQPDAVTNASDGSVWFAEQNLPGVGHLYPNNGTLVEYAWPGYAAPQPPVCFTGVSASGIAIWQGRVWVADEYGNSIVGLRPSDGNVVSLNTTGKADYPYWLAVGPDGYLWFTSDNTPAALGRISPNMSMQIISLAGLGTDNPLSLQFVNSSLAYISAINLSDASATNPSCICNGHIYSFNPSKISSLVTPSQVGSGYKLVLPTSASYSQGSIWVAQHYASNLVQYDLATGAWTTYPTSTVPYIGVTLSLETAAEGGNIWFNEHYANKIAVIDPSTQTLTEYSESNPPASNYTQIQNDLSIAATSNGLWFTSLTGNYVGFVNGSYDPGFGIAVSGSNSLMLAPGGNASLTLKVTGSWTSPMKVGGSDSENFTSVPRLIKIVPSVSAIPAGSSPYNLGVNIGVGTSVKPGEYTVLVTLTNGFTQRSAYLFISVE